MTSLTPFDLAYGFSIELDRLLVEGSRRFYDENGQLLITLDEVVRANQNNLWPCEKVIVAHTWPEGLLYLAQADYPACWTTLPEQAYIFPTRTEAEAICMQLWPKRWGPCCWMDFEYVNLGEFRHARNLQLARQ